MLYWRFYFDLDRAWAALENMSYLWKDLMISKLQFMVTIIAVSIRSTLTDTTIKQILLISESNY